MAAVDKWDLDGVDLDLEGEGALEANRAAYAAFVHQLAAALKASHRGQFPQPLRQRAQHALVERLDGRRRPIHSMGYEDLYEGSRAAFTPEGRPACEGSAALFRYSWQLDWGA